MVARDIPKPRILETCSESTPSGHLSNPLNLSHLCFLFCKNSHETECRQQCHCCTLIVLESGVGGQAAPHPVDLRFVYLHGGNHTVKTLAMLVSPPVFLPP